MCIRDRAYLDRSSEYQMMHPVTHQQLRFLLTMLRDHGEQALFAFIRQVVLPGKPFALEPPACQAVSYTHLDVYKRQH